MDPYATPGSPTVAPMTVEAIRSRVDVGRHESDSIHRALCQAQGDLRWVRDTRARAVIRLADFPHPSVDRQYWEEAANQAARHELHLAPLVTILSRKLDRIGEQLVAAERQLAEALERATKEAAEKAAAGKSSQPRRWDYTAVGVERAADVPPLTFTEAVQDCSPPDDDCSTAAKPDRCLLSVANERGEPFLRIYLGG